MNTCRFLIMAALLSAVDLARAADFDFMPPHGIYALGQIAGVRSTGRVEWAIDLTDVAVLLQNSASSGTSTNEIVGKTPAKMTLSLHAGYAGLPVSPKPEWIGHRVLFCASEYDGVYTVSKVPLPPPPSPNGARFVVFASNETSTIQFVEQVASILNMTNSVAQQHEFEALVESPSEPLFLRCFCVAQVARMGFGLVVRNGIAKSELDPEIRAKLLKWRDSEQLIPNLRVHVDRVLVEHLPHAYQSDDGRLNFLRNTKIKEAYENHWNHSLSSTNGLIQ